MVYKQSLFFTTNLLSDKTLTKFNTFSNYKDLDIHYLEIVSNIMHRSVRNGIRINLHVSPPNQSLKLTEIAVDDFARA